MMIDDAASGSALREHGLPTVTALGHRLIARCQLVIGLARVPAVPALVACALTTDQQTTPGNLDAAATRHP